MLKEIEKLPPWSTETDSEYKNFFESYGTHVVLRAALGGVLHIVAKGDMTMDENIVKKVLDADVDAPALAQLALDIGLGAKRDKSIESKKSSGKAQITVFRDGGGAVASQLSAALEKLFSHLQTPTSQSQPSEWTDVRTRWIDALDTDSVFCPDDRETDFEWLYNCEGLTDAQKNDLKLASIVYLQAPAPPAPPPAPPPKRSFFTYIPLPRKRNLRHVDETLALAESRWKIRFGHWVRFFDGS